MGPDRRAGPQDPQAPSGSRDLLQPGATATVIRSPDTGAERESSRFFNMHGEPVWSADSRFIFFTTMDSESRQGRMYRMDTQNLGGNPVFTLPAGWLSAWFSSSPVSPDVKVFCCSRGSLDSSFLR